MRTRTPETAAEAGNNFVKAWVNLEKALQRDEGLPEVLFLTSLAKGSFIVAKLMFPDQVANQEVKFQNFLDHNVGTYAGNIFANYVDPDASLERAEREMRLYNSGRSNASARD